MSTILGLPPICIPTQSHSIPLVTEASIIEMMLFLSTRLIISSTAYSVFKEAPNPSFIRTKHGTIQTLAPERLLTQQNESEM